MSIARECDLDIYVLSLTRVDDDLLHGELPAYYIVLLEDIDAANATHSWQQQIAALRQDDLNSSNNKFGGDVSLLALLKAIDGIGLRQG